MHVVPRTGDAGPATDVGAVLDREAAALDIPPAGVAEWATPATGATPPTAAATRTEEAHTVTPTTPEAPPTGRILDPAPLESLEEYRREAGGVGLASARRLGPGATIEDVTAAGLRGRGGAGFPTGLKWQTVGEYTAGSGPPTVAANAAEGEPGSFKDRMLLRTNPYRVLEGAQIAASALGAREVIFALKAGFDVERQRLDEAIAAFEERQWLEAPTRSARGAPRVPLRRGDGAARGRGRPTAVPTRCSALPTGGRQPRGPRGRVVDGHRHPRDGRATDAREQRRDPRQRAGHPRARSQRLPPGGNESLAGDVALHRVGCDAPGGRRGGPLRDAARAGARSTSAAACCPGPHDPGRAPGGLRGRPRAGAARHSTHDDEDFEEAGSGLGAAAFIAIDDETDVVALAHAVARFLAVESCGQCTPCKNDGLAIEQRLDHVRLSDGERLDLVEIGERLDSVTEGARCYLAHQQQAVVRSLIERFPSAFEDHVGGAAAPGGDEPLLGPIVDIADGVAVLDEDQATRATRLDPRPRHRHDVARGTVRDRAGPARRPHRTLPPGKLRLRPVAPPRRRAGDADECHQTARPHRSSDQLGPGARHRHGPGLPGTARGLGRAGAVVLRPCRRAHAGPPTSPRSATCRSTCSSLLQAERSLMAGREAETANTELRGRSSTTPWRRPISVSDHTIGTWRW
ncbi:MAG: NADH-ubiquinone oxidoreductase-F iron-sulfur binding region domain-containing protein [Acidimicrobiia bacterium]|nr:NADH-ubiquinone oxidoreductase-F iron-sulfur binding region domain-containing protein [Acidimicrobiia bacterium]